ncbi:MAG: hypothetical protein ACR2QO_29040 [Acidimicrobiales bacterium]
MTVDGAAAEEEITAVVAVEGDRPDPVGLLDWYAKRMPHFSVRRYLEFVDELDKTASGRSASKHVEANRSPLPPGTATGPAMYSHGMGASPSGTPDCRLLRRCGGDR